ncbi:MAG: hypothetical protein WKG07_33875 [Hymenobacter sp.]
MAVVRRNTGQRGHRLQTLSRYHSVNEQLTAIVWCCQPGWPWRQQPAPAAPNSAHRAAARPHAGAGARRAANRPDKAPRYPGGPQALGTFFSETHQSIPQPARVKALTGNVLLNATVGTDGRVSNFSGGPAALAGVRRRGPAAWRRCCRRWQPAIRRGVPLPVAVQLPVPFGNGSAAEGGEVVFCESSLAVMLRQ